MPLASRPLTDDEVTAFLGAAVDRYAAERSASGEPADTALRIAREQTDQLFPGGRPGPGQVLLRVLAGDTAVGMVWIGPHPAGRPEAWWVWYVEVDEAHRGHGYGRGAMEVAESEAKAHGATELGLNVFGGNTVARSLYESMGYQPTAINMRKEL
jgi:GNAT superfamily N-acetyltransferase